MIESPLLFLFVNYTQFKKYPRTKIIILYNFCMVLNANFGVLADHNFKEFQIKFVNICYFNVLYYIKITTYENFNFLS